MATFTLQALMLNLGSKQRLLKSGFTHSFIMRFVLRKPVNLCAGEKENTGEEESKVFLI